MGTDFHIYEGQTGDWIGEWATCPQRQSCVRAGVIDHKKGYFGSSAGGAGGSTVIVILLDFTGSS
jgi:hypothetical protein